MPIGVIGRKCGMTRLFTEDGASIPVTVVEVQSNRVAQVKTDETDGYRSIQVAVGTKRANLVNKALAGHYAKAGVEAARGLKEFRLAEGENVELNVGDEIKVDIFNEGQYVDVQGRSKGKGFQGGVRRHNFGTNNRNAVSLAHRTIGSTGQCQTPGRVFKGKKMPGHMGDANVTVQSLQVVKVDSDRNLLLIKGAIPGAKNGDVLVLPSIKREQEAQ